MPDKVGPAAFKERAPWWGGDLQTLRNRIADRGAALPGTSSDVSFTMSDGSGDRIIGKLEKPTERRAGEPLILLIHGLTGCEDSTYIRETARFHLRRGRCVIRLNLRGAGPGRRVAEGYYHAGCARDLHDVLGGIDEQYAPNGIFAIGFSLGGNILLNLLAELQPGQHLLGAATVSAPVEPSDACQRLMQPRNVLYHAWLLRRMKHDVLSSPGLSKQERDAIEQARSVYAFDDTWVAPRNGFDDAQDYYQRTAGARFVNSIKIPTLLLHAANDPWIPAGPYRRLMQSPRKTVEIVLAQSGGHVGFHEHGHAETWHDRVIARFLDRIVAGTDESGKDQHALAER